MTEITRRNFGGAALSLAAQLPTALGAQSRRGVSIPPERKLLSQVEAGWQRRDPDAVRYVEQLREAYRLMQARAGDQRLSLSLNEQMDLHAGVAICRPDDDGIGDPNHLKDLHSHVLFVVWHRAMLYYHERILGALVGDPVFRLPVWDWEVTAGKPLPEFLTDATAGGRPNPLYRKRDFKEELSDTEDIQEEWMSLVNFRAFSSFAGRILPSKETGQIEELHAPFHDWVGGDLACLRTSGRDPVFYMHHANIDRLWSDRQRRFRCAPAGRIEDLPKKERDERRRIEVDIWGKKFSFIDAVLLGSGRVRAVEVSKPASWFIDHTTNLGYGYSYPEYSNKELAAGCADPIEVRQIYEAPNADGAPRLSEPPDERLLTGRFDVVWRKPEQLKVELRLGNNEIVNLTGRARVPDCVPAGSLPVCGPQPEQSGAHVSRGIIEPRLFGALLTLLRNEKTEPISRNILRVTVHVRGR